MSLVHYTSSSDEDEIIEVTTTIAEKKAYNVQKRTLTPEDTRSDQLTTQRNTKAELDPDHILTAAGQSMSFSKVWSFHIKLSSEMFDVVSSLTESARKLIPKTVSMLQSIQAMRGDSNAVPTEAKSAEDAAELHISLTRPIYLQALHIGQFISEVRDTFKRKQRFKISFSGLQAFSNDDGTRSFLSLRVGSGHSDIERLLVVVDEIVERYAQPKFYPDPQFHASFAWAVGGDSLTKEAVDSIETSDNELCSDLRRCSVLVQRVAWKTGQKVGAIDLDEDILTLVSE
ncbi:hypothetical protein BG004_006667 [Podila humilis]|nr:hypothetical protein BG004_006667 [Podila humilis]